MKLSSNLFDGSISIDAFISDTPRTAPIPLFCSVEELRISRLVVVLTPGVKCYATRHYNVKHSEKYVLKELFKIANELSKQNIKVLRRKIERVVFDDRIDTVKCTGACVECHMDDYKEIGKVI
jgi:hypothetical protein